MKHWLSILALFLLANFAFGQTSIDTVYLDSNWEKATKNDYEYFRVLSRGSSDLYDFIDYWKSGELLQTGSLSSTHPQTREGEFKLYRTNGNVRQITNFTKDQIIGQTQILDENGQFEFECILLVDSLDNASQMKESLNNFISHISKEIKYPKDATINGIEGKVMAKFYIDASGKVSKLTLIQTVYKELDNEAVRVIEGFKKWPSPTYKGKNTNFQIVIPIDFRLPDA